MKNRLRVYGQVVVLILYLEKKRGLFLDQSVKKIFISAKIKVLVIKPCVGLFSFDRIWYLGQSESLEFLILRLKFRYSEKATKIGPSSTGFWHYFVASNESWKMGQIFVAFSEYLNFNYSHRYLMWGFENVIKKGCSNIYIRYQMTSYLAIFLQYW